MATATKEATLTGARKAAVIISSIGLEAASAITRALPDDELEAITAAMTEIRDISRETRQRTLSEFADQLRSETGSEMIEIRELLERSIGVERATSVIAKARAASGGVKYFECLDGIDSETIFCLLRQERPQTLALILCHLDPKRAAEVLAAFAPDFQTQILVRIGRMNRVSPQVIERMENVIRRRLGSAQSKLRETGGPKIIAQVLNHIGRDSEKLICETLQASDASLLDDVKRLMLVFDDLSGLSQKSMQAILRETDMNDVALALKGAKPPVRDLFMKNLSSRAAERLTEEMELMGPKPKSEVEAAQQRIIAVVRRLEEEGKVQLSRGGKDDELVA